MKKILILFLTTALSMNMFVGCSKSKDDSNGADKNVTAKEGIEFPLKDPVKLTYYMQLSSTVLKTMDDSELYKEIQKRTGIDIEFIHPPEGQSKEQLNLIIASGDLPDIIEGDLNIYSGGAAKAFEDGVIVDLTDLQKKYAPNLSAIYAQYPDLLVDLATEKGNILSVPFIRGHENLLTSRGPELRRDWLKDVGLKEPATIDEWYTVLKAFKEKKGAIAPITGNLTNLKNDCFVGGFNTSNDFYVQNGKVVYGPITPNYKDYLTTIAKWYKEGLIDSDIATNNAKIIDSRITNGQSGVLLDGYVGSTVGKYMGLMEKKDPKFGNPFATISTKYFRASYNGPFVQDQRYLEQYYTLPQQKESYTTWSKYQKEYIEANTKIRGTLTPEENSKVASILSEVNTYKDEMYLKILMGQESVDKFDAYVQQLKKMGIDDAIKIRQDAYDRFMKQFPNAAKPKSFNVIDYYKK